MVLCAAKANLSARVIPINGCGMAMVMTQLNMVQYLSATTATCSNSVLEKQVTVPFVFTRNRAKRSWSWYRMRSLRMKMASIIITWDVRQAGLSILQILNRYTKEASTFAIRI